ncbi:50S ribosomal protein L18 [Dissulfurirhabdus thermomarina]|uniref:Large ribosomal subunit protein uL18 n=1 Tax=Dissulfurirhabdus thermomarina TaxID=1765737 RepID=A0A6N9TNG5_DISTH|nr:50S ribosomal protein L18 [Dissulfurirhabdus thermomarina]NDY41324.1 50S ribosomal protein L18 [Dissulfurirhabdus thermomarina]NMX23293.1 50S ribosomal protein L18 [Dissulfurirhabdus thermomarina]
MGKTNPKVLAREKRRRRIRKRVFGTVSRPRLAVFRSARHIYAQLIDDEAGRTLAAASSLSRELREGARPEGGKTAVAAEVGRMLARVAKEKGITRVAFDRGGFLYHGRVKALADGAREGGLEF